ncbi:hypothetical protein JRQ81_019735 [Phrynocephalus forsythii]|uniref:Lysosomal proton-coupled steroid conjugate and bile acid symporter SLC46A3 n=1 Tax=Phrynocephalus forsythii TaxID=171643 RepID=A0A9Q0XQS8_9SAUR|nr:hypothetical protein JRQ81_019735 [Phrynocephalus forsythii]
MRREPALLHADPNTPPEQFARRGGRADGRPVSDSSLDQSPRSFPELATNGEAPVEDLRRLSGSHNNARPGRGGAPPPTPTRRRRLLRKGSACPLYKRRGSEGAGRIASDNGRSPPPGKIRAKAVLLVLKGVTRFLCCRRLRDEVSSLLETVAESTWIVVVVVGGSCGGFPPVRSGVSKRRLKELKLSSMRKILVVEPVISTYMFAYSLTSPLMQQYVYRRYWEEMVNSTFIDDDNVSYCDRNQSDPTLLKQKEVQEKTSLFAMKVDLCGAVPSILMAFVLVANGERCGRKISLVLPLVGSLICSVFYSFMSFYHLPLVLLLPLAFASGLFGGMATFLGGAFSFIVDLCETQKQKTIRIAVVDSILGLMSGLGGLASGFILKGIGFEWTFLVVSLLHLVNIFYTTCCLDETVRVSGLELRSVKEGFKEIFSGLYILFRSASCEKRTSIILLLCSFMTYLFTVFGGFSLYTLYELNAPLCWSAIYIGYGSAASTVISLAGILVIVSLARYLRDIYLVFIGIFSCIGGMVMTAFATTTLLMFLARVPSVLVYIPIPVLRSMLSKVVLPHEQGTIFACIACLEVVTGTITVAVFNSLYAATVAWFPGFVFLFSAGICLIPLSLLCWILFTTKHEESVVHLMDEEGTSEEHGDS